MTIRREDLERWSAECDTSARAIEGESLASVGVDPVLDALVAAQVTRVRKARDLLLKQSLQIRTAEIDTQTTALAAAKAALQAQIATL